MLERCSNPNHIGYKYYGGRGIKVCERWRGSFLAFLADIGQKPSARHTIDRYPNPDGDYEPTNCRWATYAQQRANQRPYDEGARVQRSWDTGNRSRTSKGRIDLTGQRFGRLLVIAYSPTNPLRAHWLCRCDCGNDTTVAGKSLRRKLTTSCGCYNRELARERALTRNKQDNPALYRWGHKS